MKAFSAAFWALLVAGVAFALFLLNFADYREARTTKIVMALVLGSFLIWLKGRSRRNGRS
jgi:hypothetical protein